MKGDFSRKTFRKEKHYRKVNMQQGRVQLDADWNEQADILLHNSSNALRDMIGKTGGPIENAGFRIKPSFGNNYRIEAGHYYVDGVLCENEEDVSASKQPDLPLVNEDLFEWEELPGMDACKLRKFLVERLGREWRSVSFQKKDDKTIIGDSIRRKWLSIVLNDNRNKAHLMINDKSIDEFTVKKENGCMRICYRKSPALPSSEGTYLVYLDVWERHITGFEDPELLDPALGGVDTTTRTKVVWQVKTVACEKADCIPCLPSEPEGRGMQVRSKGGYQGPDNKLYRVEIHNGGVVGADEKPTFKWSRDNGSIVAKIKRIVEDKDELVVAGVKGRVSFVKGQWIEIIDDRHELYGNPGTFVALRGVRRTFDADEVVLEYYANTIIGDPLTSKIFPQCFSPKVRRWDVPTGPIGVSIPATNAGYIPLEEGIEVRFKKGTYVTGDYWLIPARSSETDIIWPQDHDKSKVLPPEGIEHHFCPLAILKYRKGQIEVTTDCRNFFPAIVDVPLLYYVGGDGQKGLPGSLLPFPLMVCVAIGSNRIEGVKVRFKIEKGDGFLMEGSKERREVNGVADITGLVRCYWKLGKDISGQQVKAVLLDADDKEISPPLYFSASIVELSQIILANTGLIELNKSRKRELGPFSHGLQNIDTPPAILLGLVDSTTGGAMFMDGSSVYSFSKGLPRFKVQGVNLKGFNIEVEQPVEERLILRWWAIPALEQKLQIA
jgi:hypothetical protein